MLICIQTLLEEGVRYSLSHFSCYPSSVSYLYCYCFPPKADPDLTCQTTSHCFLYCYTISIGNGFVECDWLPWPTASHPGLSRHSNFPIPSQFIFFLFTLILTEFSQAASDIHCWRPKPSSYLPEKCCAVGAVAEHCRPSWQSGFTSCQTRFTHGSFSPCFPPELVSTGPLEVLDQLWQAPASHNSKRRSLTSDCQHFSMLHYTGVMHRGKHYLGNGDSQNSPGICSPLRLYFY